MPIVKDGPPAALKPYISHGVDLTWAGDVGHATADCPFCGKQDKFSVEVKTGRWRCWSCGSGTDKGGGNSYTFLRELWKAARAGTNGTINTLATARKLLYPETLTLWEVATSPLTGNWLVPGYGPKGGIDQLYRYQKTAKGQALLPTGGMPHAVHGANLYDAACSTVWVCEGAWDGMALWETMRYSKPDGNGGYILAGAPSSLLKEASVLAVAGANNFVAGVLPLLAGKDVILAFDSDHPGADTKASAPFIGAAGHDGIVRACRQLKAADDPPRSIRYVHWGDEGFDPTRASGWDVRDELTAQGLKPADRQRALAGLFAKVRDVPDEWVGETVPVTKTDSGEIQVAPIECTTYKKLKTAWRKAMLWTDNLEYDLLCSLAAVVSTDLPPPEQLWFLIISPPSSGKTTIAEAIGMSKKYCVQKDTMTGLFSGFQTDVEGKEDMSLILKLKGKTLIIKDGDTLLKNKDLQAILSQLRALYDRNLRTSFKNKMSRNYEEIGVTVLINGTDSLIDLDESELGERFLHVKVMDGIDTALERDIMERKLNETCNKRSEGHDHAKAMSDAKRMTCGYVERLRSIAREGWDEMDVPQKMRDELMDLALFVAHMRARPSGSDKERAGRELGVRLVVQLARLAKCLAIVLNKEKVDNEVMKLVRRCAGDSAAGATVDVCRSLHRGRQGGLEVRQISIDAITTEPKVRDLLLFLMKLGIAEQFDMKDPKARGVNGAVRRKWRLTKRAQALYGKVAGDGN